MRLTTKKIKVYPNLGLTPLIAYDSQLGPSYTNPEDGGRKSLRKIGVNPQLYAVSKAKNFAFLLTEQRSILPDSKLHIPSFIHPPHVIHYTSLEIKKQVRKGVSGCYGEWGRRQERVESYIRHQRGDHDVMICSPLCTAPVWYSREQHSFFLRALSV